jgi:hypothetical protein
MDAENTVAERGAETRFKPGNPGRPKGSRNKLGEAFLEALHDDFQAHGAVAIAECREHKPDAYLKVIASILPKQAEIKIDNYEHMDDGQLRAALSAAIRDLATFGVDIGIGAGQGGGQTIEGEPARLLPTLQ